MPGVRTLYVHRPLLNGEELRRWAAGIGLATTLEPDDFHATVCYSRVPLAWHGVPPMTDPLTVLGGTRRLKVLGEATVLGFESPDLTRRWRSFLAAGASHDFPGYQPHVTLTYAAPPGLDLAKAEPFTGELRFGPERYAEVRSGKGKPGEVPLARRRVLLTGRAA